MIEAGGGYYLVSTGPGIPIHCSKDMQVWDMCGRVFNENPNWVVKAIVGVKEKLIDLASNPGTDAVERAFIIRRGDFFYLFVSHDFCCKGVMSTYNIRVGRSKAIQRPYLDREGKPLTRGGGTLGYKGSDRWRGPGHNSIFIKGETYYMVYHAYDAKAGGIPSLRIEALVWEPDGWPQSPSALLGQ